MVTIGSWAVGFMSMAILLKLLISSRISSALFALGAALMALTLGSSLTVPGSEAVAFLAFLSAVSAAGVSLYSPKNLLFHILGWSYIALMGFYSGLTAGAV